jgi:5-methylcytosine-specific restriction protein A
MPKAPGRCGRDGCRNLNPCPIHPRGWASAKDKHPLPTNWVSLRLAVAMRDGKRCAVCGSKDSLELDHIRERSDGGSNDLSNLRFLCKKHHLEKTYEAARIRRRSHGKTNR